MKTRVVLSLLTLLYFIYPVGQTFMSYLTLLIILASAMLSVAAQYSLKA